MDDLKRLLTEISQVTNDLETNYPELYRLLDENPMTIPAVDNPHIDKKIMQQYLESLKGLLEHHIEEHKNMKQLEI
jgi:hypothetical protein